jgi:CDP-glycerol glycerophosphotransferase (TagB/SpsB family)
LNINSIVVEKQNMTINISGEFIDESINSRFLSTPKVILYFDNGQEDRRIPMVISMQNITYIQGKCMFHGQYSYRLDYLFWKTRGKSLPCDFYFNLSFADFYEEKVNIDVTPDEFIQDNRFFVLENCKDHFVIKKNADKLRSENIRSSIVKKINGFIKFICFILSIPFIPIFVIEGLLTFTGYTSMPKKIESENKIIRLGSYVLNRMCTVSKFSITMDKLKRSLIRFMYKLKKHRKVQSNKITFFSARREEVSGNFEFVYNKLKDDKNLDINFLFNTKSFRYMTWREIKDFTEACATSKVVILDEYTPQIHLIDLKPETKLVQLWHACGAFKTFGFTRLGKPKGSPQATRNHRSYDYVTVSSAYCKKCHSEGFGIDTDNVVPTGIARTDIFFDEEYKNNFKKEFFNQYPNFKGKKIVLFAPTFRGNLKGSANYPMELFDINEVCDTLGEDYAIIIKHHPFILEKHPIPEEFADRVIDLSENTEINDLLFISDMVITDYSSLVFEASLMNIPMLFYAYDLQSYIKSRDFYFDFKLYIPGKICTSLYTLLDAIKKEDFEAERIERFRDMFFDNLDGNSSQRIADLIYKCLKE